MAVLRGWQIYPGSMYTLAGCMHALSAALGVEVSAEHHACILVCSLQAEFCWLHTLVGLRIAGPVCSAERDSGD